MKKIVSLILICAMAFSLVLTVSAEGNDMLISAPVEKPSSWAAESISLAKTFGILTNELDGKYTQAITRAEFCSLLVNLITDRADAKLEKVLLAYGKDTSAFKFEDTQDANMIACYALGIISGTAEGKLSPNDLLTREQAAGILHNVLKFTGHEKANSEETVAYADNADISTWAAKSVNVISLVKDYGNIPVMGSTGNNNFSPKATFTREMSVVTIMRMRNEASIKLPAVTKTEKIYEAIEKACVDNMVTMTVNYNDETLLANYGLSSKEIKEYKGTLAMMMTSNQEFLIAEVQPGMMDTVKAACLKRQSDVDKASGWYVDGETIRNYKLVTNGNYIIFAMSRSVDKAVEVFNTMTK